MSTKTGVSYEVADEIAALKDATRTAHEAISDLRHTMREYERIKEEVFADIRDVLGRMVLDVLQEQMTKVGQHLDDQLDQATDAVFKRMDRIYEELMGLDKQSARTGEPSIPEIIAALKIVKQEGVEVLEPRIRLADTIKSGKRGK